ncbi:hypothetical protein G6031_05935 [Dietzia sp. CQ4]|uniref:hypothetical protein n=1 Tax=Dietzia sp. (strain CQ4) TaxID=370437 RepID=UPI0015FB2DA3|nr:hypothetical protein [Dietzia sp. CQ4]MBB1033927.1 hypothetical protein [Dietzia sp. CQ4]
MADDQAQLELLESRMKLWEFARLQTNAVTTLDILLSDTFETWFKKWPPRAPHNLIGETPASAFYKSSGVELADLIRLGRKLWSMGEEGVVVFSRESLLNDSTCPAAVDLLIHNAALSTQQFRDKLSRERKTGNLTHRRYIFSQFPVLKLNDEKYIILRPHWVADRLCGTQLYWQAFSGFGGPEEARAQQLSGAMNYVFERNVDYLLRRVHKRAPQSFTLIKEKQMQEQWAKRSGPSSVCDWVLRAGNVCILLDATNHWLDFKLAQGLADEKHYVNDLAMAILKKVEQFSSTAKQLLLNGWDSTEIGPETLFVPIIIVPNAGLPLTAISDLDLARRSHPILNGSADHFTAPGILTWQDLQVVEGLCQHRNPSGLIELLTSWRSTCTWEFPVRLQTYLDQNGLDRPMGSYPSVGRRLLDQILERSE